MTTKSRERIYGSSIRFAAEQAALARKEADRLACDAWNKRMLGYRGPAQPSPTVADALNAGFGYLEPDSGTTNIRNVNSAHWKRWLTPANRCLVPFTSF